MNFIVLFGGYFSVSVLMELPYFLFNYFHIDVHLDFSIAKDATVNILKHTYARLSASVKSLGCC